MYKPVQPSKKRSLRSLAGRAAEVLQKRHGAGRIISAGKRTDTVARYQRPWKMKRLLRSLNICLAVLVAATCIGWFVFEMLVDSDILLIAEVEMHGNRMVTEQQVLEKAALKRGDNLLDLDIARAEGNVLDLAWVDGVTIRRHWPSTLEISIREHRPLALINLPTGDRTQLYFINADGYAFAPAEGAVDLDYPVLTGPDLAADLLDMRIRNESLAGMAMQFLRVAAQGNQILPLQAVSEVQVNREKGLIVFLVDNPFPIYLGNEKIRERYYLLVRVLAQLYKKDKVGEVNEIRMDYAEDKIMVARTGGS